MQRRSWSWTTAKTVMLSAAVAGTGALAVSSDAGDRPTDRATPAAADQPERLADLLDGVLLDLASGRLLAAGDALPDAAFVVLVDATVRVAGREIELRAAEYVDDLSALGGPPMMQSGTSHECALPDDTAWATADGGCKDLVTGLVWSTPNMGHPSIWTAAEAAQFVADSTEGGYTDWRLPTVEEMDSAAEHGSAQYFSSDFECHIGWLRWSSLAQGSKWQWVSDVCTVGSGQRVLQTGHLNFVGVRDAGGGGGPECGDDFCDPGEDCNTCPNDCPGKPNGPPSGRYCCGNGIEEGPEGDGTICDGNF